jgi:hypothetical protein
MKTGPEFLDSRQNRLLDLAIGYALAPVDKAAEAVAWATFAESGQLFFTQERVGQNGGRLILKKIRTLDDNGEVLSSLAESYRGKGIDELPQFKAIREGTLSFFGSRPLIPNEYDYIRDKAKETNDGRLWLAKHDDVVIPRKRGLFSRLGLYYHAFGYDRNELGYDKDVVRRLRTDVIDHENANIPYILKTVAMGLRLATHSEILRSQFDYKPNL